MQNDWNREHAQKLIDKRMKRLKYWMMLLVVINCALQLRTLFVTEFTYEKLRIHVINGVFWGMSIVSMVFIYLISKGWYSLTFWNLVILTIRGMMPIFELMEESNDSETMDLLSDMSFHLTILNILMIQFCYHRLSLIMSCILSIPAIFGLILHTYGFDFMHPKALIPAIGLSFIAFTLLSFFSWTIQSLFKDL